MQNILSKFKISPLIEGVNKGIYQGKWVNGSGRILKSTNPFTGEVNGEISSGSVENYTQIIKKMSESRHFWSQLPMPKRGNVVREIGNELRKNKKDLASLITAEVGKINTESLGEVQEAIDICDYAVGLSRMIKGSIVSSERPDHFLVEKYNPLKKNVGIITAFNFPIAVFFWNTVINIVAGNTQLWKPSEITPLTSIACTKIISGVLRKQNLPGEVCSMILGEADIGEKMSLDPEIELMCFTGSTEVGRKINSNTSQRFGKTILELGGNAASIITDKANIDLAVSSVFFGAIGTSGQRCTTTRRVIVHESIYDQFLRKLTRKYSTIEIGDPRENMTTMGPLINKKTVDHYEETLKKINKSGFARTVYGGEILENNCVEPAIIACRSDFLMAKEENFVPILYIMKYDKLEDAIKINNDTDYGLSSSIFSSDISQISKWIESGGSDCGVVNVNTSTSGAEIGLSFGGNKSTGWGRQAGSDSWKQYMRRSSISLNYGERTALQLSQGVKF